MGVCGGRHHHLHCGVTVRLATAKVGSKAVPAALGLDAGQRGQLAHPGLGRDWGQAHCDLLDASVVLLGDGATTPPASPCSRLPVDAVTTPATIPSGGAAMRRLAATLLLGVLLAKA